MNELEALRARHSVRRYVDEPLSADKVQLLRAAIDALNAESGLSMQLVVEDPAAFKGSLLSYGMFKGVRNYMALVGPDGPDLDETCGYFGQRLVLFAQMAGLNTCWVGMKNFSRKAKCSIEAGQRLALIIAIGVGETQGRERKSKAIGKVSNATDKSPAWFTRGVEAALLAPTAMNQQRFFLELTDVPAADGRRVVRARSLGGPFSNVDLGIVRYNFEVAAGVENFTWGS